MFLWFAGAAFVVAWSVFRSRALDYRMVMLGAVLPVVEAPLGGPWLAHTLLFSVATLGTVMLATRQRRLLRRQLIGVPIGLMLHLALDGTWARGEVFWWPLLGNGLGAGGLPAGDRGLVVAVLLEVVGLVALVWAARRFDLTDPARREVFWRTGQLDRTLGDGGH